MNEQNTLRNTELIWWRWSSTGGMIRYKESDGRTRIEGISSARGTIRRNSIKRNYIEK